MERERARPAQRAAGDAWGARLAAALGDRYALRQELGGGGMSRVFLAEERALGRRVVVKLMAEELSGAVDAGRFRREVLLSAQLQHPHIVPVLATGEADGAPYFVMPFVDGETLRARLARGPLPIPEAVRVLRDVAAALAYAHGRGVVHRDVKPDNVLLSGGIATVTDFGVAKALGAPGREPGAQADDPAPADDGITVAGFAVGTPAVFAEFARVRMASHPALRLAMPGGAAPMAVVAGRVTRRPSGAVGLTLLAADPATGEPVAALREVASPGEEMAAIERLDDRFTSLLGRALGQPITTPTRARP